MGRKHTCWKGIGNKGTAKGMNDSEGSVFTIPYPYTTTSPSVTRSRILASNGGAGNTCSLKV